MSEKTLNILAGLAFGCLVLIVVGILALLGWGFVEIIQWITSK